MLKTKLAGIPHLFTLVIAFAGSLLLLHEIMLFMRHPQMSDVALANAGAVLYVASTGSDVSNDCTNQAMPCSTIQHAVDSAQKSDEIRVAGGIYTDLHVRPRNDSSAIGVVTQVVYISQSLSLEGGYATSDWNTSYPQTQTTTLDAKGQGRVIYVTGNNNVTIQGLYLTGGHSLGMGGEYNNGRPAGGGVYAISATVTIRDSRISGVTATVGSGAYFLNSANAIIANNVISDNFAYSNGGGIRFQYSPGASVIGNEIRENSVIGGGMTYNGGISFESSDNALLLNNIVSRNSSQNGCGGICLRNSSNMTLENNIVTGNYSGALGGGGLSADSSTVEMRNNVFVGNYAGLSGSGLNFFKSAVEMWHTTIVGTSGNNNAGIKVDNFGLPASSVGMTNTVLVSYTVGISIGNESMAFVNGILWHNNISNTGGTDNITITNEFTGTPAFDSDGYHLTAVSAAIDKGVNVDFDTDVDGYARRCGKAPDLGADEFCYRMYLPIILYE